MGGQSLPKKISTVHLFHSGLIPFLNGDGLPRTIPNRVIYVEAHGVVFWNILRNSI